MAFNASSAPTVTVSDTDADEFSDSDDSDLEYDLLLIEEADDLEDDDDFREGSTMYSVVANSWSVDSEPGDA